MRRLYVLALLVALFTTCFTSVGSAAAATSGLTSTDITAALSAHNSVRQRVAQSESTRLGRLISIPNVVWDNTIAAYAQDWANQQAVRMQQGYSPVHRPNNPYGENMYWAWSSPTAPN